MWHAGSYFADQGSNTVPPAVEVWSPNHWIARDLPRIILFITMSSAPRTVPGKVGLWEILVD